MKISILCSHCGKRLRTSDKAIGRQVDCPACGKPVQITAPIEPPTRESTDPTTFETTPEDWQPETLVELRQDRRHRRLWIGVAAIVIAIVAGLVVIPPLLPKDPRAVVLQNYLAAVRKGDFTEAAKHGVLDEPPMTASNSWAKLVEQQEESVHDSFGPIAELHRFIGEKYKQQGDVFVTEDMTGQLARLINLREDIQKQNQQPLMRDPKRHKDDLDAAVEFAESYAGNLQKLADIMIGGPENKSAVITYEQILEQWKGPLTGPQRELLDHYRKQPAKWRKLLGRDFTSIREASEFTFEQSHWDTTVWLPNQSAGDDPKKVRFTLVRFQVGLIDSGWKVWDYRVQ